MKCIDADKLISEVERTRDIAQGYLCGSERQSELSPNQYRMQGIETICSNLLSFITSLQQEHPKIDLEKELRNWMVEMDGKYALLTTDYVDQLITDTAEHFYKLGLNARKEK